MAHTGGKGRAFQTLINLMPPHETFVETHLGGGAVMLRKRPARTNIGIDLDPAVIASWRRRGLPGVELVEADAVAYLRDSAPGPGALVLADPPYWPTARRRRRCYRYDYSPADHIELLDVLGGLDCLVIVTGYANPVYDEALAGWHVVDYANWTQTGTVTERAWLNYEPPCVLHDYDHLGADFREREALRRRRRAHVRKLQRALPLERNAIMSDLANAFPEEVLRAARRIEP